ncbi:sensor histidine kinase [Ruminococcus gauvreauii]|uniref:histidine kinase n=1 Tax=Ruminococcus gauvreauii TaxID=438033 RepID=A0ABY5VCL7_9FIRM|nr:sensor histidine kinase [Ruminococcus gauvreauii]UWP57926.1 sensor histidine kinase [Ruminococcus gauvreauii]
MKAESKLLLKIKDIAAAVIAVLLLGAQICVTVICMYRQVLGNVGFYYLASCLGVIGVFVYMIRKWVIPVLKMNRILSCAKESEDIEMLINELDKSTQMQYPDRLFAGITELINREQKAQILSTEATIHALQSQINPHFLYNTLETIRSKAILQGNEEIAKMNEALATLFRYNISRPGEMATLADEMENVESYLIIQQYRFRDKFKAVKIFDETDGYLMSYMMPILTIQPIVENAIHHGLENKVGQGEIMIRVFTTQDRLIIIISDDGVGIPEDQLKGMRKKLDGTNGISDIAVKQKKPHKAGIALQNVHQRIKFYYGEEYGLEITSTEGCGTTVEIHLPKIYDFKEGI